jgi:hypothetical protein
MNFDTAGLKMLYVVGHHFFLVIICYILESPAKIIVDFFKVIFELSVLHNKLSTLKLVLLDAFLDAADCDKNGTINLLESSCV